MSQYSIPVIRIVAEVCKGNPDGFTEINAEDYDPSKHKLFEGQVAPVSAPQEQPAAPAEETPASEAPAPQEAAEAPQEAVSAPAAPGAPPAPPAPAEGAWNLNNE